MIKEIKKNVSRTIDIIETFFSEHFYEVRFAHESINEAVAKTTKKEDGLYFECAKMILTSQNDGDKLLDNIERMIEFSDFHKTIYFNIQSCTKIKLRTGLSGYTKMSGYINEFTTKALNEFKNGFYRAVIITQEDIYVSGHFNCNTSLIVENTVYASGVLEITLLEMPLHIFSYADKVTKRKYFIIESRSKIDYEKFVSIFNEFVLSLTYLTGIFLGHDIYVIGSPNETFEDENSILGLRRFFDDLKSSEAAIPNLQLQHEVKVKVQRFQLNFLEQIVTELINSLVYKRTILLICQAHSEPHYVKSTLYSVALETITNIISEKIDHKINLIPDKDTAKQLRGRLKKTLNDFKSKLSTDALKKIEGDIERINSPTNKLKLLAPFKYLNIILKEKDINAIERRNDFLHGRIPENADKHHVPLINARLLFCINCLVLKQIGYSGYVIYYPVIYQINNKLKPDEFPLRDI